MYNGKCRLVLCKDWAHDGCHWGQWIDRSSNSFAWNQGGGCGNGVSSYIVEGNDCWNKSMTAYANKYYTGFSENIRNVDGKVGHRQNRTAKSGCHDDWWSAIRIKDIPRDGWNGNYRYDTDADSCPGAARGFGKPIGKRNACFYSKTNAGQLNTLSHETDRELKTMHNTLSDKFCSVRDNITKNPGGTSCWDRKHATDLAREYCEVGNRITSDMCDIGKTNHIGRQVYDDLAEAYCKTDFLGQGENDEWCACQNVMRDSGAWCKKNPTKPGCKDVMTHYNAILATVPEKFHGKFPIERIKCMKNVCTKGAGRWNPPPGGLDDQCRVNTQICNISFDQIVNSDIGTINASCEQSIKNNQKAADDKTASDNAILERLKQLEEQNKNPSPSSPSSPSSPPSPSTRDENYKKMLSGGVFSFCCLILLIILFADDEINNNINL